MRRNQDLAAIWERTALMTLATAKSLRDSEDHRSCVSRAYYAAYQAATSVCIAHGDAVHFPPDWHNPTHEQLPDLITNNGDLSKSTRRAVRKILLKLRTLRETSDYRVGWAVDRETVRIALLDADSLFKELEINDGDN